MKKQYKLIPPGETYFLVEGGVSCAYIDARGNDLLLIRGNNTGVTISETLEDGTARRRDVLISREKDGISAALRMLESLQEEKARLEGQISAIDAMHERIASCISAGRFDMNKSEKSILSEKVMYRNGNEKCKFNIK